MIWTWTPDLEFWNFNTNHWSINWQSLNGRPELEQLIMSFRYSITNNCLMKVICFTSTDFIQMIGQWILNGGPSLNSWACVPHFHYKSLVANERDYKSACRSFPSNTWFLNFKSEMTKTSSFINFFHYHQIIHEIIVNVALSISYNQQQKKIAAWTDKLEEMIVFLMKSMTKVHL